MRTALLIVVTLAASVALAGTPSQAQLERRVATAESNYRHCLSRQASDHYTSDADPTDIANAASAYCLGDLSVLNDVAKEVSPKITGGEGPGAEFYYHYRVTRTFEMAYLETLRQVIDRRLAEYH